MLVPEAASYLNSYAVARKNDVGLTRKVIPVEAKAVPKGVNQATNNHLRLGVLVPDERHLGAADGVSHALVESAST